MAVFSWKTLKEILGTICGASLGALFAGVELSREAFQAIWGFCAAGFAALAIGGGGIARKQLPPPHEQQAPPRPKKRRSSVGPPKRRTNQQRRNQANRNQRNGNNVNNAPPPDQAFIAPLNLEEYQNSFLMVDQS